MKYTTLKNDITSILHSSDYDFVLKFYDKDGNTTIKPEDAQWIYITNQKIMLELFDDENPVLNMWKEQGEVSRDFEKVIQRIRELSILNGVSVQIRLFNDLNRRRIYNLIKNSMESKKEEDMNESLSNDISKALYELSNTIHNTNRSSDLYISESLIAKNKKSFMEDVVNSILCIESLNNSKIKSLLSKTLLEYSYNNINKIVKVFERKYPTITESLFKNISNIQNVGKFIKQRYLNNFVSNNTPKTMLVLENVKVYPIKTKNDMTNITKAYNHLLSVSKDAKTGTDILLAIKRNNICETYSVSKNDLLDMWLSKAINEKVTPSTLLVFENVDGDTLTFNMDMKSSIGLLAEHFNKNGLVDDTLTKQIVNETIKLNQLTDLIENHSYKTMVKKYAPLIKQLYQECLQNLDSESYEQNLSSLNESVVDYSKELTLLEEKMGFTHPSLKYIAIVESKENLRRKNTLLNEQRKDVSILKNGLALTHTPVESKNYASSIVAGGLVSKKAIKENKSDKLSLAKALLENIQSTDVDVCNAVKNSLFVIINNPSKYNPERDRFVKTLKKYII